MSITNSMLLTESFIARLVTFATGVSALVGAAIAIHEYADRIAPDDQTVAKISEYEEPPISDSRIKVQAVVDQVYRLSDKYMPDDCGEDQLSWSRSCHAAVQKWRETFVETMGSEASEEIIRIVKHFKDAIDCARGRRCDEDEIISYYGEEIRTFWETTHPYIKEVSISNIDYAWLAESCQKKAPKDFCRRERGGA